MTQKKVKKTTRSTLKSVQNTPHFGHFFRNAGVRKRQREGTLERMVKYDVEAFETALDYLADEEEEA